jgi:hypothetical protein
MPIVGEFDAHKSVAESDDGIEIQSVKCMGARGMTLREGQEFGSESRCSHRAESRDVGPAR